MKISIVVEALTASFTTDLNRASKEAQKFARDVERQFKQMGVAIGTGLAVAGTALAALTAKSIQAAGNLAEMSQKVGVSVESLSTLGFAAQQSGVEIEQLQGGLVKLAKNASDASQGIGTAKDAFAALGIEVTKADGSLKGTDELLREIAGEFSKYEDGANKTALAVGIFGRAGAELIPLLNEGAQGIGALEEQARALGLELSTNTAQQAEAFGDQLDQLKALATGLGNDIATALLPSMVGLTQAFIDSGVEGRKTSEVADTIKTSFDFLAVMFIKGVEVVQNIGAAFGFFVDVMVKTGEAAVASAKQFGLYFDGLKAFMSLDLDAAAKSVKQLIDNGKGIKAEFADGIKASSELLRGSFQTNAAEAARKIDAMASAAAGLNVELGAGDSGAGGKGTAPGLRNTAAAAAEAAKKMEEAAKAAEKARKAMQDVAVAGVLRLVDELDELESQWAELDQRFAEQERDIKNEIMLLGLSTAERERAVISLEAERLARDQNGIVIEEQRKRYEELLTTLSQAQKIADAAREFENIWLNAANSVGDALTTALFDGAESGADAIKNVMENLARDLVQFWLRQNIVVPIQQQLFGGVGGAAGGGSAGGLLGGLGNVFSNARQGFGNIMGGNILQGIGQTLPAVGIVVSVVQGLRSLFGGDGKPRFRVADRENDGRSSSRLDDVIGVARDNMQAGSATALANGIRDFDNAIAEFLNDDEIGRVRDALANWTTDVSGSAATIENVLGQRFGAILSTFPEDVRAFVEGAATVEERVQRLAEALSWDDQIDAILGGLRRERDLAGMDEAARQAFLVNEQFDALAAQMTAMHATEAQLAELEEFRAEALANLTVAMEAATEAMQFQEQAARDYAATVNDINRQLAEASGASEFQLSLQDIAAGLNENVARLNETARAAGLLSAREEDLGRAHLLAAAQAARAMAQLEEAGRSLAADLYGSEMGDIEAEIARIEAESSGASSAIASFGDAIRETAEAANRATDLLLGDLSPLRDRQKLPLALQAFQRGEIQAEQVLEIGRRLMASGADYNQLFDQVLAIERSRGGAGQSIPTGGGGVQVSGSTDARLLALMERRDELEQAARDAQRFTQASDLAQIVADLAGARGEDFGAVLGNLSGGRATLEQFASDLGLDSVAAVEEYLRALQADSYGIADIAATITAGDRYIVDALRDIFDYQTDLELKPDGDLTKPIRIGDAPTPEPIVVAPPTEPTPGEREIGERIGDVDHRIGQMEGLLASLLQQIADNTGRFADGTEKNAAASASWAAGAKPRSVRSDLVKG